MFSIFGPIRGRIDGDREGVAHFTYFGAEPRQQQSGLSAGTTNAPRDHRCHTREQSNAAAHCAPRSRLCRWGWRPAVGACYSWRQACYAARDCHQRFDLSFIDGFIVLSFCLIPVPFLLSKKISKSCPARRRAWSDSARLSVWGHHHSPAGPGPQREDGGRACSPSHLPHPATGVGALGRS